MSPADRQLWHAVVRDVRPLVKTRPRAPSETGDETKAEQPTLAPAANTIAPRPAAIAPLPARGAPNPGIDRRTAERLRRGQMAVERTLDLHGMTQERAHAALDYFLRQAWGDGVRVLLIVTGRGLAQAAATGRSGGVLRQMLPRWLAAGEHRERVLRLEPAQPKHGGAGAFYVLLRRRRELRDDDRE